MGFEFKLPDIGEGVVEGEIVKWLVGAGDAVDVDQPMVEVMTDKATVVIPSPRKGTVQETRGAEGDVIEVGAVLVVLDDAGAPASSGGASSSSAPSSGGAPSSSDGSSGGATPSSGGAPSSEASSSSPSPRGLAYGGEPAGPRGASAAAAASAQVLAAPATRRLAREMGVELGAVTGTGPAGRITSDDVKKAASGGAAGPAPRASRAPAPSIAPPGAGGFDLDGEDEVVPVRGIRGRIWDGMTRSKFTAPHFTFVEECDMTELVAYRKRLNELLGESDAKLTFLPFLVRAVCAALNDFPDLNGQVNDAERSFVRRASKHIGIAVASERGLTVPVVRHAHRRSLKSLAAEIRRLGDAVRAGTIAPADLGGSTFTITSLGKDGGLLATPIINHPEVGIMGVHRLQKRPVVRDDDEIVVRSMMNLSLSFDHRWIDGHVGAQFTYRVIELLERPDRLVLEMG